MYLGWFCELLWGRVSVSQTMAACRSVLLYVAHSLCKHGRRVVAAEARFFLFSSYFTFRQNLHRLLRRGRRSRCKFPWNLPHHPVDNIRVMLIVWRLRGNIVRAAPCWVVWHNVHSQQHTLMSSSYRSCRFGLSHWDLYAVRRGSCIELYYSNTVEWCWWNSSLIWKTNWFPSVLWHCWFGHMTCKNRPRYDL